MTQFNNRIRQVVLLIIILLIGFLIVKELYVFLPGFLGAVTVYIIGRSMYFRLVEQRKWNKSMTALLFMLAFLVIIGVPLYYAVRLVTPKISLVFSHSEELMSGLSALAEQVKEVTGMEIFSADNMAKIEGNIANFIPTFLNSTANILSNLLVMFFVLFFMLVNGREMEKALHVYIPLRDDSINRLATETMQMVRANAVGIPLISIIQGITAMIGYWIFGLKDWGMWGFLTGVFAFFPIVGTMLVWLPLVIYLYSQGMNWQATGLMIYSLMVTGNVDYLARITLMKKIGDVHPLITIFGVIVGLKLFGFMGFIFGPLVFSYLIILWKIYTHEFVENAS
ncbi:MAG: AI-2E family transporter [Chitinophagaceae bacterium]|jgi:predicted PurR-regulated permease PerM|nr:AI-2E family transporter [Chitinophagaceae bacterium]